MGKTFFLRGLCGLCGSGFEYEVNQMMHEPGEAQQEIPGAGLYNDSKPREPELADAVRFLYQRRTKLALRALVLFVLGALAFAYSYLTSPKIVEGTLGLSFRGIEKSEYPSGKRFTVEDFRGPGVLTKALADAAISNQRIALADLAAHVYITPVVPGEIQSRWKKQDQAGAVREEYSPSEFRIAIEESGLTDKERLKLFDGLVKHYQETVKYDQKLAKGFVNPTDTDYEKLAGEYDPWDIPDLFRQTYKTLTNKLNDLITESLSYQDASYQLSLRGIAQELETWEQTRLEALEALTYHGHLVRNRDIVTQRIQYRAQDFDIQIRQKSQEASESLRLLEVIEQPKTLVIGRESSPIVDSSALDRLVKDEYVRPVVQRISSLQEEVQALQADKARLENQLSWLPKSSEAAPGALPAGYGNLTTIISRELGAIIQKYDRILDDYLTVTITSLVIIKQAPIISRGGYAPAIVLLGIAVLSIFLAIILLGIEHLFSKARKAERTNRGALKGKQAV
jgi:hypothetical protein